jgi:hypothetical protein
VSDAASSGVRQYVRAPSIDLVVAGVTAVAVLGPTLGRGFVLTYDMVFVPRQPLQQTLLGLGGAVPRAVPSDLVVALASRLLPGDVVQKVILVAILVGAGVGAGRLSGGTMPARVGASVLYVWNPFVYERLVLGHWALLIGYASLPWVVGAALGVRDRRSGALPRLGLALTVASVGGASATIVPLVVSAGIVAAAPRGEWPRRLGAVVATGVAVNLPWLVPGLLLPGGIPADPGGVAAFAARPDTPLGTVGSLLTLGGIWNGQVVPRGRDSWLAVPLLLAILALAGYGLHASARRQRGLTVALLVSAAGGLFVAMLGSVPLLTDVAEWLVTTFPGGGLLRDGQKFVMTVALAVAVGFGAGVTAVAARLKMSPVTAPIAALTLPVIALPALAWGAAGRLESVNYPRDWAAVAAVVRADTVPGAIVTLPWQPYRRFEWNDNRTLLDPAPRWLARRVVFDDDLPLEDRVVEGEDPLADDLDTTLSGAASMTEPLRQAGVRWVLVAHRAGAPEPSADLMAGAHTVYDGHDLALLRLDDPAKRQDAGPPVPPVVVGDAIALLAIVGNAVAYAVSRTRRRAPLLE